MCKIEREELVKILELQDVTYTYEGEKAPIWELLSCSFYQGKIHAISGPSGCGKSSLLYLLNGLIPHMYEGELQGKVLYRGKDITATLAKYRCEKIGLVMQNPENQFCTFTVEEELAFGMENLGFSVEEIKRNIKEILKFIDMAGYEEKELNHLSGGQKQKIAIASILVTKPSVLLLDEPTANLDPENRRQVLDLIVNIARKENITVIIVEHNIADIIEDVDFFIELDKYGKINMECRKGEKEDKRWRMKNTHTAFDNLLLNRTPDKEEVIVHIEDISFAYPLSGRKKKKERNVINHLNLDIYKKELLAIVGENGVGKSTLMKLLFKIYPLDCGEIYIYGKPLSSYKTKELYNQMGFVFQNPENQFVTNSVKDEMMFSLKRTSLSRKEKEERVNSLLEKFHLEKEMEKSPFALSQGQKRRLSVASMLLTNQNILFLDEPTYGQDFENRQQLMRDMKKLVEQGITVVMITHDMELVNQYATRVVKLERK